MKITIKTPSIRRKNWNISFGANSHRTRSSVTDIWKWFNKNLPQYLPCSVKVIYSDGNNETVKSDDTGYLQYATGCFLEDYLSKDTLKRLEKKWLNRGNSGS